jgi:hypothetical protein
LGISTAFIRQRLQDTPAPTARQRDNYLCSLRNFGNRSAAQIQKVSARLEMNKPALQMALNDQ